MDTRTDKARVTAAFKALRKQGIFARQNFLCCQGCACSDIYHRKDVVEYAFYHQQDRDAFRETKGWREWSAELQSPLYIAFGLGPAHRAHDGLHPDHNSSSIEVANKIVAALRAEGLKVTWDGDTNTRIEVEHIEQPKPEPPDMSFVELAAR